METLKMLISESDIKKKIKIIAKQISNDYNSEILVVCILKGGVTFCADLIREISKIGKLKVYCDYIRAKSYEGTESTGEVKITGSMDLIGKNVIIIEDIIDTGKTLFAIVQKMKKKKAKSVRICTLLDKSSRRIIRIEPDYLGFKIPDKFVVGYGLDYNEEYRELPYIAELKLVERKIK